MKDGAPIQSGLWTGARRSELPHSARRMGVGLSSRIKWKGIVVSSALIRFDSRSHRKARFCLSRDATWLNSAQWLILIRSVAARVACVRFPTVQAEPKERRRASNVIYLRGGRNEEAVMPLLFWYPIIVWSSMCSLALDTVTPRKPPSIPHRDQVPRSDPASHYI